MGQNEVIEALIKFNKDVVLITKFLVTYCWYRDNYYDLVKVLIDNGADIHIENDLPLIYASRNGYYDIVELLTDNGANIHAQNDKAFNLACYRGHNDIVDLFYSIGHFD